MLKPTSHARYPCSFLTKSNYSIYFLIFSNESKPLNACDCERLVSRGSRYPIDPPHVDPLTVKDAQSIDSQTDIMKRESTKLEHPSTLNVSEVEQYLVTGGLLAFLAFS